MITLILKKIFRSKWNGSQKYWDKRYSMGGNSGAGSYNRLAEFKAEVINDFVSKNRIGSVLEWGCGDGNQLSYAKYPQYIGLDVSKKAIEICRRKYKGDKTKEFIFTGTNEYVFPSAELGLSLDVIYHLVEDNVFELYMKNLFSSSEKYIIIYSCNEDEFNPDIPHVKKRKFTGWIEKNAPEWKFKSFVKNRYPYNEDDPEFTSWSDFYIYEKGIEN